MDALKMKTLFVGTAEAEHVEMYLKAFGTSKKREEVKIAPLQKCLMSTTWYFQCSKTKRPKFVTYNKLESKLLKMAKK